LVGQLQAALKPIDPFSLEFAHLGPNVPVDWRLEGYSQQALSWRLYGLPPFGKDRKRFQRLAELQECAGVVGATEESGKKCWAHCH
jgi:hypothetical protein